MSTNNHNDEPPTNGGSGIIDPCAKRIREEAEYNRGVRCKNCKLIFCIIASIAVATAAILMISGALALWPASEGDNPPLILTIPQQCCQDNDDNDDDNDRDYKHKHKDKHHNDNDDDD